MAGRKKPPADATPFVRAAAWIEAHQDDLVALEAELTRRNAVGPGSGGPGEAEKAGFLEAWLAANGFPPVTRLTASENGVPRPNLVVTVPGRDRTRRIWFMSHLDVVPPGDLALWKSDPFVMRKEGEKLVGRGVEDNQQGIVCTAFALKALLANGVEPGCDVGLLFVADEESGSAYGIRWLLDNHPELFRPEDEFVVPDAGNEDGSLAEVAEKTILWLKVRTVGKQVHASTPHLGKNAFVAGASLVVKLRALYEQFDRRDPIFDPPMSTFEPTRREANVANINTIPGEDVFYVDCRVLPGIPVEAVLAHVRGICVDVERAHRVVCSVDVVQREDAAPATPASARVVRDVVKSVRRVYGVDAKARGIGGGTVAGNLRKAGYPVVVWSRMDETAHQPNEYVWIPNLIGDAKVFADMMIGEIVEDT
ncbi:MAG: M20 family metallo-hydrolase [Deltaproteobacteria bacterium]|nr:M20 family metallo-hydrolase [Deltaproteobacteria bacterium]